MSSVCQPFGERYGDGFGTSYEGSHQLMWAQGIFRARATTTQWGLDFIAANLRCPTVVLHYPTMDQFIEELGKGYEYVGIAFVASTFHKMVPMTEAIRKYAPKSKIVLGGYGTALGKERLGQYADHICHGEGVAFMRDLLGEPVETPFVQPDIKQSQDLFSMKLGGDLGYVFAGLGCPNGCDFCATSAYFGRRHVRLLPDGQSILDAIIQLRRKYPDMVDFWLNDEDFLLNEKRGREFLEAIRASDLPALSLNIFSSVKALSQFKASELVEMGIDFIWVGFEGKRAGYKKMDGRSYRELFADLHAHGITVLTSMIVGFDYQTPEIIREEFEDLMSMRPSICQFLIYGPAPGTPLLERLGAEGRLIPEAVNDSKKSDGFSLVFEHPHIGADQMVAIQRGLYREAYERLGPSVFRVAEDWMSGAVSLRDHPAPRVRAKAQMLRPKAHRAMLIARAAKAHVNDQTAAWLEEFYHRLRAATGPLTPTERILSRATPAMLWYTDFKIQNDIGQQPEHTRRHYRMAEPRRRRKGRTLARLSAVAELLGVPILNR